MAYIIKANRANRTLTVKSVNRTISLKHVGRRGLQGETGAAGVGVPTGGTSGQVLTKDSGTDYDTSWQDPTGGGAVDSVNGQTGTVVLDQDDVADGTTYKQYSATEKTKLSGIETGADVTDATNVAAAGATMNTDTTLAGNGYFLDEDTMSSNSATKVPSQQSVKAYVDPKRATFSNANATISYPTTHLAQIGTMSANRTVTLPAASAYPSGASITVMDESGTVGKISDSSNYNLIVTRAGSDTIVSPLFPNTTTTNTLTTPYESRTYTSNGTDKWIVTNTGQRRPIVWFSHANAVAIPSGVATPLPWNKSYIDNAGINPLYTTSYTLHSSMNGLALPQSSITVNEDISALPTSGFIVITGPPATGVDTVVYYTGINTGTNTFTGCNASPWAGISTGTMATSQVVKQAFVGVGFKVPYLYQMGAIVTLTANPNGYRQIDMRGDFFGLRIPYFTGTDTPAMNINNQHLTLVAQPPAQLDGGTTSQNFICIYQNSGSVLQSTVNGLETSILYAFNASGE